MNDNDFHAIEALDLEPIKVKLMHEDSGEGWSRARADAVEKEYRRFLYLMKKYPDEDAAPLMDVDTFWHYHILDTLKYAVDCQNVFGYFLHHFPYVGLRGAADEEAHHRMGERMRELYEETFGEDYVKTASVAWSARATEANATAWSAKTPPDIASKVWSPRAPDAMKTAWSARAPEGMKTAWSARAIGAAWSASPGKAAIAWSASPGKAVPQAQPAADSTGVDSFYTERPRLAPATA